MSTEPVLLGALPDLGFTGEKAVYLLESKARLPEPSLKLLWTMAWRISTPMFHQDLHPRTCFEGGAALSIPL